MVKGSPPLHDSLDNPAILPLNDDLGAGLFGVREYGTFHWIIDGVPGRRGGTRAQILG